MYLKNLFLLAASLVALAACNKAAHKPLSMKDAPPATIPEGWNPAPTESLGCTVAFPPDWHVEPAQPDGIKLFVQALNDKAWSSLGEKKADVDFDTVQAMIAVRQAAGDPLDPNGFKFAEQTCLVLKESLDRTLSYDDAVHRWFDVLKESTDGKELKQKPVELPVGLAATLTKAHAEQGMVDRTSVWCLADGHTVYTFFFQESATDQTPPTPIQQIMETLRLKR